MHTQRKRRQGASDVAKQNNSMINTAWAGEHVDGPAKKTGPAVCYVQNIMLPKRVA